MSQIILNLTQHASTPEQKAEGVLDVPADLMPRLQALLTFEELPEPWEVDERAQAIAAFAREWLGDDGYEAARNEAGWVLAMIGGAPFLMGPLWRALWDNGLFGVFAFSRRESVETPQPDGSVRKTNVFKHVGFVGL